MATVLARSTKVEYRSVIRFLWAKGKLPCEIHREMCTVYGDTFMSRPNVAYWCSKFASGCTQVLDEERSGRPHTSSTNANIAAVDAIIQADRRVHVRDIALQLDISTGSVHQIIHRSLQYRKVSARWVPRQLTEAHKATRMACSLQHLQRYEREGNTFLDNIITGDESWVHHYTPDSKEISMVWKLTQSPPPKKFKTTPSAGKAMVVLKNLFKKQAFILKCTKK